MAYRLHPKREKGERDTESEGWKWTKVRLRLSLWISAVCTVAGMAYSLCF